jgi:hypothetical protein
MPESLPLFLSRRVMLLLLLVTAVFATNYLRTGIARVLYPYDLDFIEDAMLMQSWQVAQEQPVFVPPNADFVPQVYMPLYTWLGGQLFKVTGPVFWPLRLLSLLATLATAVLLAIITRQESGDKWLAFIVAGLFLAGYRLAGGWYDLARVDALFVFLALAGVTAAVYGTSDRGMMVAGLLLGLAFLTKQHGLLLAMVVAGYLLLRRQWRVGLFIVAFGLITAVPLLILQQNSQGWLAYYVITIAYASPLAPWGGPVLGGMALAGGAVLGLLWWYGWLDWLRQQPWPVFVAAAVFITISGMASVGGNLNNMILGYAFFCLLPAIVVKELPRLSARVRKVIRPWLPLAILLQFALTIYNPLHMPSQFVPTRAMRQAGDAFIGRVTAVNGDVLVMLHPFYALLANKSPSVHVQSLWHSRLRGQEPLPLDLVSRIENQEYAVIISDQSPFFETEPALLALIEANYRQDTILTTQESAPTLSGLITRPQIIYVPRER